MAKGWNSGSDREATLRRVAIVLSSLPGSVASQLMGGIDADAQQEVRRTMASLTDVDPLERKRALHAFKVSVEQPVDSPDVYQAVGASPQSNQALPQSKHGSMPVNWADQHAVSQSSRVVPAEQAMPMHVGETTSEESEASPFAFLRSVNDETLVQMFRTEHPQTVALVLASISPNQAAHILPRLDAELQRDALSRIGRLGEIPETAVSEVAAHFRGCLSKQSSSERNAIGRQALDAILAAMPTPHDSPRERSPESPINQPQPSDRHASVSFPSAERAAADLSQRLRGVEQQATAHDHDVDSRLNDSWPAAGNQVRKRPSNVPRDAGIPGARPTIAAQQSEQRPGTEASSRQSSKAFESSDGIHQHLVQLPPQQLCETLGRVDTRVAMLALCGLPNPITDEVLAVLPRSQAKQVRQRMNSLGSLQLREIDQAKEIVAEASLGLNSRPVPQAA